MEEYKEKCDKCKNSGSTTFARVYHKKINNRWIFVCKNCWNKIL